MKLLFDQNLSPRLVPTLADLFPESPHVRDCGMHASPDQVVWEFAGQNGLTIVSKDDDFHQRSFLFGHPPKVIGMLVGNCPTSRIATTELPRLRGHDGDGGGVVNRLAPQETPAGGP